MSVLHDELISYADVVSALAESTQNPQGKYSIADLRLLGKALGEIPEALRPHRQFHSQSAPAGPFP